MKKNLNIVVLCLILSGCGGGDNKSSDKLIEGLDGVNTHTGYLNHAPSFIAGPSVVVLPDSGVYKQESWARDLDDGDGGIQQLSFNIISNSNPSLFVKGPYVSYPSKTLTFTPKAGTTGIALLELVLRDDGGTANNGQNQSKIATFTIEVKEKNHAPTFTEGPSVSVLATSGAYRQEHWAGNYRDNDTAKQKLHVEILSNSRPELFTELPNVSVPSGTLKFTPNPNKTGTSVLELVVVDNGGTALGGEDTSAVKSVSITTTPDPLPTIKDVELHLNSANLLFNRFEQRFSHNILLAETAAGALDPATAKMSQTLNASDTTMLFEPLAFGQTYYVGIHGLDQGDEGPYTPLTSFTMPTFEEASSIGASNLNDTGVTRCTNDDGAYVGCSDLTAPWGQDGTYASGYNASRVKSLLSTGSMTINNVTSSCYTDSNTNLMWVQPFSGEDNAVAQYISSIDISNSQNQGAKGSCTFRDDKNELYCNTEDLIKVINQASACGCSSWSLPERDQLRSVVDYDPTLVTEGLFKANNSSDDVFNKKSSSSLWLSGKGYDYWSQTFAADEGVKIPSYVWVINAITGEERSAARSESLQSLFVCNKSTN